MGSETRSHSTDGKNDEGVPNDDTGRLEVPANYDEFLDTLLSMAEQRGWAKTFLAGEWVFHAGEIPEECWLIGTGRIAQYRGETLVSEFGPRRFLGMRAFHLQAPHTTSAQAVEPSVLIRIGGEFYQRLLTHQEFVDVTIKQYEQEVQRVGEMATKYRAHFDAAQREIAILQRSLESYEKGAKDAPRDVRVSISERTLRLLFPDLEEADKLVSALLLLLPEEMQRMLRNSKEYGQLVSLVSRCWNRVKPFSFLRAK